MAAVSIAALAAGCGGSSSRPAAAPERVDVSRAAAAISPSAAYQDDGRAIALAEQRLIRGCMARHGFEYPRFPAAPEPPASTLPADGGGYGLRKLLRHADLASLRQARRELRARARPAYRRALEGSGDETATVATGWPPIRYRTGGCAAGATDRLYAGLDGYQRLLADRNAAAGELEARLRDDVRLAAALSGWRACMARRGLPYPSPEAARGALFDAYLTAPRPGVHARELATAAADRACALRAPVYAEGERATRAALRSLPAARLRSLEAFARNREAAAERGRALLDAH